MKNSTAALQVNQEFTKRNVKMHKYASLEGEVLTGVSIRSHHVFDKAKFHISIKGGFKMRNKHIAKIGIIGLAAIFLLSMAFISSAQMSVQKKPIKPPSDDFQDMPLCIDFLTGDLNPNIDPLCNSSRGITAYAGRRRTINLTIRKNVKDPYLTMSLGGYLTAELGDPDPANDGGDLPVLGPYPVLSAGRISSPELQVGIEVNIKDMEFTEIGTNARLYFEDESGLLYMLCWGPAPMPGGFQRTNPNAPFVSVTRNDDAAGKRNWNVTTLDQDRGLYLDVHTAFLWVSIGPWEYCGAFDVSFSYFAIQE